MSDLLARLIEAGTPAALVAEVAAELARAQVAKEAIEQRRASDRDRSQRRRRHVMSRDITGDHETARDVTGDPSLPLPPNENNSNPPAPTHPDGDTPPARKGHRFPVDFPCPAWADPDVWADLLKNRKTKNSTNTATAHRQFVRKVEGMADDEWPPGRLLEAIVALGWGGAYDPREKRNDRPSHQLTSGAAGRRTSPSHLDVDQRDGFERELDDRIFGAGASTVR